VETSDVTNSRIVELAQERGTVVRIQPDPDGLFGAHVVEFARRAVDGTFSEAATITRKDARAAYGHGPTIHRVIDAAKNNTSRPTLPGEEQTKTIAHVLKRSPLARAALLRAIKVGATSGLGGYLGYRAKGRKGFAPAAKAGAIAGLLFSQPEPLRAVTAGVLFSMKVRLNSL
jgi:hypothetical protein